MAGLHISHLRAVRCNSKFFLIGPSSSSLMPSKLLQTKTRLLICLWWHTPIIPSTQEAKPEGFQVQGQPEKFSETLPQSLRKGWGEGYPKGVTQW